MSEHRLQIIAHRGGTLWAPENTLAAFRRALDAGCQGIELDVQRCATGELVVFHDPDVGRTTNGVGLIRDISYPELQRLSAGLWFDQEFAGERIPLLQEVLDLVAGRLTINVEIKNTPIEYPGIEDDLLELLSGYGYRDEIIISSFDHRVIKAIHEKAPDYKLALLADALMVDIAQYSSKIGATFWHPCIDALLASAVEEAHAAGLTVNAWTLNDIRLWTHALRLWLDGIITDDPAGLSKFLSGQNPVPAAQVGP